MQLLTVFYRSGLSPDDISQLFRSRFGRYSELEGLVQKIYVRDPASGILGGLYLFDTREHLDTFLSSDLAGSIGPTYQASGPPSLRTLDVLFTLTGPAAEGRLDESFVAASD